MGHLRVSHRLFLCVSENLNVRVCEATRFRLAAARLMACWSSHTTAVWVGLWEELEGLFSGWKASGKQAVMECCRKILKE